MIGPEGIGRKLGDVLLVEDLAEVFDVSPSTASALLVAGAFGPAVRCGRRWVVTRESLLETLRARQAMPVAAKRAKPRKSAKATQGSRKAVAEQITRRRA